MRVEYLVVGHSDSPGECICLVQNSTHSCMEAGEKSAMTPYEFGYQIVLAWFGMLPKRNDSSQKWTIDSISSSGIKKARPVNNFTLDPAAGLLKGHLTTSTSSCGCYPKTQCVLYVIGPTAMKITIELLQGCGDRALVHAIFAMLSCA